VPYQGSVQSAVPEWLTEPSSAVSRTPGQRPGMGCREETAWLNLAAAAVLEVVRNTDGGVRLGEVRMERLKRLDGEGNWDVTVVAELMVPRPMRRVRASFPVKVRAGKAHTPDRFLDAQGRCYSIHAEAFRSLVTTWREDHWDNRKLPPRADRAITDRTLLPEIPARSFFSLA